MPFSVKGYFADRPLMVTKETARRAFAKAVEWHVVERFTNVSISDGIKDYTIAEFASLMALTEIDQTMDHAGAQLTRRLSGQQQPARMASGKQVRQAMRRRQRGKPPALQIRSCKGYARQERRRLDAAIAGVDEQVGQRRRLPRRFAQRP